MYVRGDEHTARTPRTQHAANGRSGTRVHLLYLSDGVVGLGWNLQGRTMESLQERGALVELVTSN